MFLLGSFGGPARSTACGEPEEHAPRSHDPPCSVRTCASSGPTVDSSGVNERLGDPTPRERDLIDAAASGEVLECGRLAIEQLSSTDDPVYTIRAELLRSLLLI